MSGWIEDDELPDMDTDEGRRLAANFLLQQDEWCEAMVIYDEHNNMIARFRYEDGREELFDLAVRRKLELRPPVDMENAN